MSEFFLELFSEEIPSSLQKNLRMDLINSFNKLFEERFISFKKNLSYSTPNRLIIVFEGLKKKIDKGEFYFYKINPKTIYTHDLLEEFVPLLLQKIQWKKSMKWGNFDLNWGRPLKSILAVFDKKKLTFNFHHLRSSNLTFIDKEFEEKKRTFYDFKSYESFFKKEGIIIDQDKRKKIIEKEFEKILIKKNLKIIDNQRLLEEVVNLTDKPNILECFFDKKFLSIPKEILILTMQVHQKYFPLFTKKGEITNEFLVVANNKDKKGLIKLGNERVVEARLHDAEFFWNKDKSQNLVKKVSKLKEMNFFKGLGTYFDKVQRMRKLGALISDELLISKDKVELTASICKTDLISESVGEFPELQGVIGGHLSSSQGFEKDTVDAIKEQYLPVGLDSTVPKKPFSITLSVSDKIDTLVGFFGVDQKPSSSKDPYALRRTALGIIRIIIENKKDLRVKDLISYSSNFYLNQGFSFQNEFLQNDIMIFLRDRFKFYLKEKDIRHDIIEASINAFDLNKISLQFEKSKSLNKVINTQVGYDIISSYKRAHNILQSEVRDDKKEFSNTTDPGIFKTEFEKNLHKRINELNKYFSRNSREENFDETLILLSSIKKEVFDFFDNVKVNDENTSIKKNRLELINILCKTFENYTDFHLIEDINE